MNWYWSYIHAKNLDCEPYDLVFLEFCFLELERLGKPLYTQEDFERVIAEGR